MPDSISGPRRPRAPAVRVPDVDTAPAVAPRHGRASVVDEMERVRPSGHHQPSRPLTHTVDGPGVSALDLRVDAGGGAINGRTANGRAGVTVDGRGVTVGGGHAVDGANGRHSVNGTVVTGPDGRTNVHVDGEVIRRDGDDTTGVRGTVDIDDGGIRGGGGLTLARRGSDGAWRTIDVDGNLRATANGTDGQLNIRGRSDGPAGTTTVDGNVRGSSTGGRTSVDGRVNVNRRTDGASTDVQVDGRISNDNLSVSGTVRHDAHGNRVEVRGGATVDANGAGLRVDGDRTRTVDATTIRTGGGGAINVDARGIGVDARGNRSVVNGDGSGHTVDVGVSVGPDGSARGGIGGTRELVHDRGRTTVGGNLDIAAGPENVVVSGGGNIGGTRTVDDGTDAGNLRIRGTVNNGSLDVNVGGNVDRRRTDVDGTTTINATVDANATPNGVNGRSTVRHVRDDANGRTDTTVNLNVNGTNVGVDGRRGTTDATGTTTIVGGVDLSRTGVGGRLSVEDVDPTGRRSTVDGRVNVAGGALAGGIGGSVHDATGGGGGGVDVAMATDGTTTTTVRGDVRTVTDGHDVTVTGNSTVVNNASGSTVSVNAGVRDRTLDGTNEVTVHVDVTVSPGTVVIDAGREVRDIVDGDIHNVGVRADVARGRGDVTLGSTSVDGDTRRTEEGRVGVDGAGVSVAVRRDTGDRDGTATLGGSVDVRDGAGAIRATRGSVVNDESRHTDGVLALTNGGFDGAVSHRTGFNTPTRRVSFGVGIGGAKLLRVHDHGAVVGGVLDGKHRIVTEFSTGADASVGGGVALGVANVGAGIRGGKDQGVAYVTHVAPERAALIVAGDFTERIPDVKDTTSLQIGDAVTLRMSGAVEMSMDASIIGIGAGGRAKTEGEFEFTVEKIGVDRVRVNVKPKTIHSVALEGRAIVLRASVEGERASSLSQTFELDVTTEAGRRAYANALDGNLPEIDLRSVVANVESGIDLLDKLNETMPDGVRAVRLANEKSWRTTTSVGISWAFLSLGRDDRWHRADTRTVEPGRIVTSHDSARESVRRTWYSGEETTGVYSAISQVTERSTDGTPATTFRAITLGARLGDTEVEDSDLDDMITDVRDALGVPLALTGHEGVGERRTIDVNLEIDAQRLEGLSRRAIDGIDDAAIAAGADTGHARDLMRRLLRSTNAADRAHAMQDFVAKEEMAGLGTLVRAFPTIEVHITASETGDERQMSDAEAAVSRHEGGIEKGDAEAFFARFADLHAHRKFVTKALQSVARDPFLTTEKRAAMLERAVRLDAQLDVLLDVTGWSFFQRTKATAVISSKATFATDKVAFLAVRFLEHGETDDD